MGSLSEQTQALLLVRARLLILPPGHLLIDGRGNFAGIVVSGLLRVCSDDGDGRSVTYRNVARSEAVGIGALLDQSDDIWVQTVTHSTVLSIDLRVVADLRACDPAFNLALARETLQRLRDTSHELLIRVHGSVRQQSPATCSISPRQPAPSSPSLCGLATSCLRRTSGPGEKWSPVSSPSWSTKG